VKRWNSGPDFGLGEPLRAGNCHATKPKVRNPSRIAPARQDNVEHARKLYLQFMEGISQAWSTPSADRAPPGFNEIRERAIKITRENADAAFNLARDVANAKDLQELVTLQTRYVQSQMKWYAQQTQEFGRLMAKALRGAQSSMPGQD
jgi:hypothetical protein